MFNFLKNKKVVFGIGKTESEMRESKSIWPKTEKELIRYIRELLDREHDYGTCVYAMSLAAVASFHYIASKLGVTGFQASCADLDILRRTRHIERFKILNYEDLLYPQTVYKFDSAITEDDLKWLEKRAWEEIGKYEIVPRGLKDDDILTDHEEVLQSHVPVHPDVMKHWKDLTNGVVPEGVKIKQKE